MAAAQEQTEYLDWAAEAERVENVLAVGAASDTVLEGLRNDVVAWRETFQKQKDTGSDRIATLTRRLEALPALPAEGESEPEAVSEARATLQSQLAQLREPAIRAQLAFDHADGLVREIDEALRARQASTLIQRLPTPVNPLNWVRPLNELSRVVAAVPSEIVGCSPRPSRARSCCATCPARC